MTDSAPAAPDDAAQGFYSALLDDDAEALYERAPCGYLSTTPDGSIVKVNATFLALTGYSRSDLVGRRTFSELLTPGGRVYHETHYAPMLRMQGTAREIAFDVVRADGRRLPVLVNSVLERDTSGVPVIVRTAVFDATSRRAYEQELLRAKERAEASEARARALAQTLQSTFIPPRPPLIPGLEVAGAYRPAGAGDEVGGDFFDVFQLGPDDWVVAIGDVRGKGADAAVVTALVRYTLRAEMVRASGALGDALATVNSALVRDATDRFCTVGVGRLTRSAPSEPWTVRLASAGHPPPLLVAAPGGARPTGVPGPLLGVFDTVEVPVVSMDLAPGVVLLWCTDGVTEARSDDGTFYDDRVDDVVSAHAGSPAGVVVDALVADVLAFSGGSPRDDIAVVAVGVP